MADLALITPLNFTPVQKSFFDNKQGLTIEIGEFSALPGQYDGLLEFHNGLGLMISDKGFDKKELDQTCNEIMEAAQISDVALLVTKSDYEFDQRWYWLGDFKTLFDLAKKRKLHLPISPFLYDTILESLENFEG